jgi:peptidoglycan/xylan/chitin deacetylase (PgdA/CDA1 family)
VFLCDYALARARRISGRETKARCVIFYYHSVPVSDRAKFARQMDILVRYATPIAAGTKKPLEPGRRYAAVTFDDAFENIFRSAIPELEARGIAATVFAVTGSLGQHATWGKYEAHQNTDTRIATAEQLRAVSGNLITFGSHTQNHPRLTNLAPDKAETEIFESKLALAQLLGREIDLFSFPFGAFSEGLVNLCKAAGYERVFTTQPALALIHSEEYVTGRVLAETSDWEIEFRLKLLGAYRWMNNFSQMKQRFNHSKSPSTMVERSEKLGNRGALSIPVRSTPVEHHQR